MHRFLILYSSTDGQTLKICQRLQQLIGKQQHTAMLISVDKALAFEDPEARLRQYDTIIIGASIRYGKHNDSIVHFVERHQELLDSKPNAFFSVNLVARKPEKSQPHSNPYVIQFLKKSSWKPQLVTVFAGKLEYPRYKFLDRLMIRAIMWMTKGPTDPKTVIEYTDWEQVDDFGLQLIKHTGLNQSN